jgi:hypothetical protein
MYGVSPFVQAYLVNLAIMRQQAPVTTLTSLTQFKARMANGDGSAHSLVEQGAVEEDDQDDVTVSSQRSVSQLEPTGDSGAPGGQPDTDEDVLGADSGLVIDVEREEDELTSFSAAISRLVKECGLDTAMQLVRWPGASGLPALPTSEVTVRVKLPQAGGLLELKWKPDPAEDP